MHFQNKNAYFCKMTAPLLKQTGIFRLFIFLIALVGFSIQSKAQICNVNLGPNVYLCPGSGTLTINTSNVNGFNQNPIFDWNVNGNNTNGNNSISIAYNNNSPNPQIIICEVTSGNNNNNCVASDTLYIYRIDPGVISGNQYVCNGSIPSIITNSNSGSRRYCRS